VAGNTTISLYIPDKDKVDLVLTDMLGRVVNRYAKVLSKGLHTFRFTPAGSNLIFFTANWRGNSSTIRILQAATSSDASCSLEYIGCESIPTSHKASAGLMSFPFDKGNEILCIGYMNGLESGMLIAPEEDGNCVFQFAADIPCPGMPEVDYEGQVYNTVQIRSQCWLKENLNVGSMILGYQNSTNNEVIEKYCYNNIPDSCGIHGGLYQWREMMQYSAQEGARGICPQGWHLPRVEDWRVLFGTADSQHGIGAAEWDPLGVMVGYDVGTNLKSSSGWRFNGNGTDLVGCSVMPAGYRNTEGNFNGVGEAGNLWVSQEINSSESAHLFFYYENSTIGLSDFLPKTYAISVRCIRDY